MGKILIVAEKPSVGRDIAKVMKATQKGDGYLYSDSYVVSWAIGHLAALNNPEDYTPLWKTWKMESLPIIPNEIKLKEVQSTKKQFMVLKKLMNSKDIESIICATDSGREGELIFRYIYQLVGCNKSFQRLWISSMTDTAIKEGFNNLKQGHEYDNLFLSAKCRSEADWLVGINATRAYTIRYNTLLSIGRVQTPTLAIITERQKEINSFVPQEYFEIKASFENYTGVWFGGIEKDSKIFDKDKCDSIITKVTGMRGKITAIEKEEKKQPPGLLYDLTELQRDCNRKYGFSAQKTLGIAQDLYEKRKMITYPRTDSRYLSEDMIPKLKKTIQSLCIEPYNEFAEKILNLPSLPITKRIIDNSKITDHHAIIPTDTNISTKSLSSDEAKVFDLIARKFLAAFFPYYVYNITRIITTVCEETFLTKGTTVIDIGYMILYQDEKIEVSDKQESEEIVLPNVSENDEVLLIKAEALKKKTKAPKAYNEATLLSAMENAGRFVEDEALKEQLKESGIGTPATRAAIIERLIEVGYIVRNGKVLVPTEKGMKLIEVVPIELKSPQTTGKWERGLSLIAKGEMEQARFMGSINKYVKFLVLNAQNTNTDIVFPEEKYKKSNKKQQKGLGKCLACDNGEIYENSKAFYCNAWKNGCKFSIWKNGLDKYGSSITADIVKQLLKENIVKDISVVLPQTMEKAKADLIIKDNKTGLIELVNLRRE